MKTLDSKIQTKPNTQRSHPWHGCSAGPNAPEKLMAYIEIVTTDTVKYELDKSTGILKIDRPQKFSNTVPALYGFVPRTFCGDKIAAYCMEKAQLSEMIGDGDPIDILVLTEHQIAHGDILVACHPIGGLRMIDDHEADDKIIAVLEGDAVYGHIQDISELPPAILSKLQHYFLTYKLKPYAKNPPTSIAGVYGQAEALEVLRCSMEDYDDMCRKLI